MAVTMNADPK